MIELDDHLRALRSRAAEWGTDLREMAMEVDRDPDAVRRYADRDVLRYLATCRRFGEPAEQVLTVDARPCSARTVMEQVVLMEELAHGDLGALLAAPGAPMAGPLVELLGDDSQQRWFFDRMAGAARWAFFALTEPARGSDAINLDTELTRDGDGFRLDGAKRYVGNAARAQVGVVFARHGSGPLAVRAVLVDATDPGLTFSVLPTIGLRGTLLSAVTMESVPIPPERILARGTWGSLRTFNLLRPSLAAMAVGVARAAAGYARTHRHTLSPVESARLDAIERRIDGVRQLVYHAATTVDADPADGSLASAAKARASRLAEDVTLAALEFFGAGARFEHPLLGKLARDARGLEFMEGTGHVHRLLMSQHVIRERKDHG